MNKYWEKVVNSAEHILSKTSMNPLIGLVTGTGLGKSLSALEVNFSFEYKDIPGFPVSTVTGHAGRLLVGRLAEKPVIAMAGRFHLYEGYTPLEVSFPVRVMQAMGIQTLIITNAAGGLNLDFTPGDIMIIRDHINLTGENPLLGANDDRWGIRFPDMTRVYDKKLVEIAKSVAFEKDILLKEGIYIGIKGPCLETMAETRFLRLLGADAVGMSTIQEVIAAVHAGMDILGLSIITNVNDPDQPEPAILEDIIQMADNSADQLAHLITAIAGKIDA